jgi:hypothetical protein
MIATCANRMCSTHRVNEEGKLFRLDFDIGSTAGANQRKTIYVWLCEVCAAQLSPRVEVSGDAVLVRLGATYQSATPASGWSRPRVN